MRKLLLALTLAALGAAALAAPITYSFGGTVSDDSADRGYTQFSGSFRFDSLTPDAIADSSTGAYLHAAPDWRLELSFDGGPAMVFDDSLAVLTTNDLGGQDQLGVLAAKAGESVSMTFFDFLAQVLGSDALPTQPLTFADFGWGLLSWEGAAGTLHGTLNALACVEGCTPGGGGGGDDSLPPNPAVPEPASLWLVLGALAILSRLRRRRLPHLGLDMAALKAHPYFR